MRSASGSHGGIAGLEDDGKLREIFRANQAVTGSGSFTRMDKKKTMTVEEEQAEARRRVDAAEAAVLTLDNYAKFSDGVYDRVRDGDPVIFILIAVIVYVVVNEVYRVLPTALACACTMLGSRLYYKRRLQKTTRRLQAVHNSALQWTPISPVETANWINWTTVSMWMDTLAPKLTDVVKLTIMRELRAAKLPWFIAGAAVKEVNMGEEPPRIGNFQVLRNRYGRQVCEADITLDAKDMRVVVRLNLRGLGEVITGKIRRLAGGENEGTSVDVVICNLSVEGRIRYFPLVGHPLMLACFANMPKVRFDINVSGLSMTAMPQMKRFIGSIISEALGRKLIFPYAIALELGSRSNVKAPERGTVEVTFRWAELWKGFDQVKSTQKSNRARAKNVNRQKSSNANEREGNDHPGSPASPASPSSRKSLRAVSPATSSPTTALDPARDAAEFADTSVEIFVGSNRAKVAIVPGDASARPRAAGMPEAVSAIDSEDDTATLRFPVTANNSRVQMEFRHAGYKVQAVISYKWCTRSLLTHAFYAAPIPDVKVDSMRLQNAEERRMMVGLHVAMGGGDHVVVGAVEADVKFLWSDYKKWDTGAAAPGEKRAGGGTGDDCGVARQLSARERMEDEADEAEAEDSTRGESSSAAKKAKSAAAKATAAAAVIASKFNPLARKGKAAADAAHAGILQVDVVQAKELPVADANGLSDPYVTIRLGKQKSTTPVRSATLSPVWEHRAFFNISRGALEKEKMVLKVFDHDCAGWTDEFQGVADVQLAELLDGELHNVWIPLRAIESGKVRLRAKYFAGKTKHPEGGWNVERRIDSSERDVIEHESWDLIGQQHVSAILSSGVAAREGRMVVSLRGGENLVKADVITGSSDPYVVVRCGSEKQKTAIKYHTLNPTWNQTFEFPVNPVQRVSGRMLLECRDHDLLSVDDFLGNATIELRDVPDDGSTQELSLDLEGVAHGILNISVRFVPMGTALDVAELAARSATTQGIRASGKSTKKLARPNSRASKRKKKSVFASCFGAGQIKGGEIHERVRVED